MNDRNVEFYHTKCKIKDDGLFLFTKQRNNTESPWKKANFAIEIPC